MAGKRALATTRTRRWAMTNNKSVQQMMRATTKRARTARAMVTAMRVLGNKKGKSGKGHGISSKGGV